MGILRCSTVGGDFEVWLEGEVEEEEEVEGGGGKPA